MSSSINITMLILHINIEALPELLEYELYFAMIRYLFVVYTEIIIQRISMMVMIMVNSRLNIGF